MWKFLAAVACAAACGSAQFSANRPVDHGNGIACGDAMVEDQITTAGQPLVAAQPLSPFKQCWDTPAHELTSRDPYAWVKIMAPNAVPPTPETHTITTELVDDELLACANVAPADRRRSAFDRTGEIAAVRPIHDATGEVSGVKVIFRPVPGLDAEWMRDSIACQQARWRVAGQDPNLAPRDPTLVDGARVTVADREGQVEVTVMTDTSAQAKLAIGRVSGANRPAQTASR